MSKIRINFTFLKFGTFLENRPFKNFGLFIKRSVKVQINIKKVKILVVGLWALGGRVIW